MSVARTTDLETCLRLRHEVFTVEQDVAPDLEVDGLDPVAVHFLSEVGGVPVGTARVLVKDGVAKIGRVCVVKSERGTGQGQALIRAALEWARSEGHRRAILGAQVPALGFYEALGFTAYGDIFDDAGIDHRMMGITL